MWESASSISKVCGKGGKQHHRFPPFPQTVISTACLDHLELSGGDLHRGIDPVLLELDRAYVVQRRVHSCSVYQSSQEMVSSLASRMVSKRRPCSRSTFSEPNNVSEQALSQQLPLRRIDGAMPCSLSTWLKSSLAYWLPRSLWKISPVSLPGLRLNQAISRASITRLRCISGRIDQPTTLRLNRSITTARNSQPSSVAM